MRKTPLLMAIGILLAGCTGAPASYEAATIPDRTQIPAGKGAFHLMNVGGWTLIPSKAEILDQGKSLASLPRKASKTVYVDPGEHELSMAGRKLMVKVSSGEIHFIAAGYSPAKSHAFPFAGDPVSLRQVSEGEARKIMDGWRSR